MEAVGGSAKHGDVYIARAREGVNSRVVVQVRVLARFARLPSRRGEFANFDQQGDLVTVQSENAFY